MANKKTLDIDNSHNLLLPNEFAGFADDYFGVWAILEDPFRAAVDSFQGINLHTHIEARDVAAINDASNSGEYPVSAGGTAVIDIRGTMMKRASSMTGGASMIAVRRSIRAAVNDPEVGSILLRMDTPGGTVAGTMDLANDVSSAANKKPLFAFVEDLTASAGAWVASQATKIFANNATARYGSIGTYVVIQDVSGAAEKLGVKVHVIRAGEFKGAGVPGTKITDEQLAEWQRTIDALNDQFIAAVASGRSMSIEQVTQLADGRAHPAAEALKMGLIDGIQTFEATLDQLAKLSTTSISRRPRMSLQIADIKSACPGASAEFIMGQMEQAEASESHTLENVQTAFISHLQTATTAASEKHAEEMKTASEKATADAAASGGNGCDALVKTSNIGAVDHDEADATGDPIDDFSAAVSHHMTAANCSRIKAVQAVAKRDPELHQAFLMATNPGAKARRLLAEKIA